jgi:hypothetical protein
MHGRNHLRADWVRVQILGSIMVPKYFSNHYNNIRLSISMQLIFNLILYPNFNTNMMVGRYFGINIGLKCLGLSPTPLRTALE